MKREKSRKKLRRKQQEVWKNPSVSFNYEPGSTFKIITSAAGLEEGIVTPETNSMIEDLLKLGIEC